MARLRPIPIELDGEHGGLAPFRALDEIAASAQIAFVGEMDHFIEEKYAHRLMCIRYLASQGWRLFGEEIPASQGQRADEYLRTGDESLLGPVAEPDWFTTGVLANSRQPTAALAAAQRRFMIAVRRVVPDARWFGFDADATNTDYLAQANAATSYEELRPAMALRERIMHAHVAEALRSNRGDNVAVLGAALHLLKDDNKVSAPGVGAGPGGGEVRSLGHHITHELTDRPVLSLWLLHGRGNTANPWLPSPGELRPGRNTLDAHLGRRHRSPCFVFVGDDYRRRKVTQMHNLVLSCRLADQVDGIIFTPRVHPISSPEP